MTIMRIAHVRRPPCGILLAALVASLATVAPACAPAEGRLSASGLEGVELTEPLRKPTFTLAATDGRAYDFRRETAGRLTLLFFGYTHCPDVCPVHLANIAAALRTLAPEDRARVAVVFVTVDPARDTPERLRAWLDAFDPSFVGLTGPVDSVNAIQAALGLPPAVGQPAGGQPAPGAAADPNYTVGHASQVIVFSPADNRAHVVYPFGTRQRAWAHDLPVLLHTRG
jgi:protein SCO1/2